jgi:hypothetical protein
LVWQCAPCQSFTRFLSSTYQHVVGRGQPLKVVFVSRDRSGAEFWEYFRCVARGLIA